MGVDHTNYLLRLIVGQYSQSIESVRDHSEINHSKYN